MSRSQLVPYEKAVVSAISSLAKGDLRDESSLVALTSDLVSAFKNLSTTATKLIEMITTQHNGIYTHSFIHSFIHLYNDMVMKLNESRVLKTTHPSIHPLPLCLVCVCSSSSIHPTA